MTGADLKIKNKIVKNTFSPPVILIQFGFQQSYKVANNNNTRGRELFFFLKTAAYKKLKPHHNLQKNRNCVNFAVKTLGGIGGGGGHKIQVHKNIGMHKI